MDWIQGHDFEFIDEEEIGIREIPSGNLGAGVGFIVIPSGVDIELYKEDVLRTGRVSIYGGLGHSFFHNVPIDREVLQRIKFPKKVGEYGTPIVWINIPKHNVPIIVACLKYEDDFHQLSENQKRLTKTSKNGDLVDIDMNPEKGQLVVTVNGNTDGDRPKIIFRLNGKDNNGQYIVETNGEFLLRAEDRVVVIANNKIEMAVTDIDNKSKARVVMNSSDDEGTDRLLYEDEFNNSVKVSESMIQILADDSSKIVFGNDEKSEPLVKGNTVVDKLSSIIDAINAITVPTAFGPSGIPNNSAQFTGIKNGLKDILSELTNTE